MARQPDKHRERLLRSVNSENVSSPKPTPSRIEVGLLQGRLHGGWRNSPARTSNLACDAQKPQGRILSRPTGSTRARGAGRARGAISTRAWRGPTSLRQADVPAQKNSPCQRLLDPKHQKSRPYTYLGQHYPSRYSRRDGAIRIAIGKFSYATTTNAAGSAWPRCCARSRWRRAGGSAAESAADGRGEPDDAAADHEFPISTVQRPI